MWQVNTYAHPWARGLNLRDTNVAAGAAKRVWAQSGGSWRPWSAYTSGAYKSFLPRARAAVAALGGRKGGGAPGASGGGRGAAGKVAIGTVGSGISGVPPRIGNQGTAGKMVGGLGGGMAVAVDGAEGPSGTDFIDRDIAMAALTPGTADDVRAARSAVDFWQKALGYARKTGDPRDDTAAAQGLKSALDALDSLTQATEEANRLQQERDSLQREQVENQRKILQLAQQGPQILAAVVAAVNGDIGGKVGLGFSTPSYAGAPARY